MDVEPPSEDLIERALDVLGKHRPSVQVLDPGTFFDDPEYFHKLPTNRIRGFVSQLATGPLPVTPIAFQQANLVLEHNNCNPAIFHIDAAIALFALAIKFFQPDDHLFLLIDGLARALDMRYELLRSDSDLTLALRWQRETLRLARQIEDLAEFWLANRLWQHAFLLTRSSLYNSEPTPKPFEIGPEHLVPDEVVEIFEEAEKLNESETLKTHITTFGSIALYGRYLRSGQETVLDDAIRKAIIGYDLAERHQMSCIMQTEAITYSRISRMYLQRAATSDSLEDYRSSLKFSRMGFSSSQQPAAHLDTLCDSILGLANALTHSKLDNARAVTEIRQGTEQWRLLDDAKQKLEGALNEVSCPSWEVSGWKVHLGRVYVSLGGESNIRRGIDQLKLAVRSLPCKEPHHGATVMAYARLAEAKRHLAFNTNQVEDFEEAALVSEQTVTYLSSANFTQPKNALIHFEMMDLYHEIFKRTLGDTRTHFGERSLTNALIIGNDAQVPVRIRINALSLASKMLMLLRQDFSQADELMCKAVDLLPIATHPDLNRIEQMRMLQKFHYVPNLAFMASLHAGQPLLLVVQNFEAARNLLWQRMTEQRSSLDDLRQSHRDLAEDLQNKRSLVSCGQSTDTSHWSATELNRFDKNEQYKALEQSLRDIRTIQHWPATLSGINMDEEKLKRHSSEGPIIIINSSWLLDAIIISKTGVQKMSFPELTSSKVDCLVRNFLETVTVQALQSDFDRLNRNYQYALTYLWTNLVKPILTSIDFSPYCKQTNGKPRVFWVSTGLANIFPMHAMGDYCASLRKTVLEVQWSDSERSCTWSERLPSQSEDLAQDDFIFNRVVSSYIPSLKSLAFFRERRKTLRNHSIHSRKAVLVGMPITPAIDEDLKAAEELEAVQSSVGTTLETNVLMNKPRKDVLAALSECEMAHFACHATARDMNPSLSVLHLEDWQKSPLTVRSLINTEMPYCQFVNLSACETMLNKNMHLLEEGITIAGGFLMIGVPNVIASMWPVDDNVSRKLAEYFYGFLKDDSGVVDYDRTPSALDRALGQLRNGFPPILWGPYTHSGC